MLGKTNSTCTGLTEYIDLKIVNLPYEIYTKGSALSDGVNIYLLGGGNMSSSSTVQYFYKWDSISWTKLINIPVSHYDYGNGAVYENNIYIIGYDYPSYYLYKYNNSTASWEQSVQLPYSINSSTGGFKPVLLNKANELHLIGGKYYKYSGTQEHYKLVDNTWQFVSNPPDNFTHAVNSVVEWRNEIHAFSTSNSNTDCSHYRLIGTEWEQLPDAPAHCDAAVSDDVIYIFSNTHNTGYNNTCTCYMWDGTDYTLVGEKPFTVNYAFKHNSKIYAVSNNALWEINKKVYIP